MKFTVVAVYEDQPQRYATMVEAATAREAEYLARDQAELPILVAGVIEGDVKLADCEYVVTSETDATDDRVEDTKQNGDGVYCVLDDPALD